MSTSTSPVTEGLPGPIDDLPAVFDGYEVALCAEYADPRGGTFVERVSLESDLEDDDIVSVLFTVYGHFESGGVHAIADAVVARDNEGLDYDAARDYALRLAYSIDAGRTHYGVEDMTFDQPDSLKVTR